MPSQFDTMFRELAEPTLMDRMGETATYRPAAGGTVALVGMVGTEQVIDHDETEGGRSAERTRPVTISTEAAGAFGGVASPGMNDQIDIGGVTYEVRSVTNKSGSLVTLECVRIGSIEKTRPGYRGRR